MTDSRELIEQGRALARCEHDDLSVAADLADALEAADCQNALLLEDIRVRRMDRFECASALASERAKLAKAVEALAEIYGISERQEGAEGCHFVAENALAEIGGMG